MIIFVHINSSIYTIAQLAVQLTCNQEVGGSIPSGGTIFGEVCLVAMAPDCKSGTLETP